MQATLLIGLDADLLVTVNVADILIDSDRTAYPPEKVTLESAL